MDNHIQLTIQPIPLMDLITCKKQRHREDMMVMLSYNIYRQSTVNTNQGEFMDWFYACNVFNVLTFDRAIILCPTVYIVVYFYGATVCSAIYNRIQFLQ